MTRRKLTDDEKQALQQAFGDVDVTKVGKIEKKELRTVLQLIGQNPTAEDMQGYLPDAESHLTPEDLVDLVENKVPLKSRSELEEEIAGVFAKFGDASDVTMDRTELINILTTLGDEPLATEEVETVLQSVKTQENGRLDIGELAAVLKK